MTLLGPFDRRVTIHVAATDHGRARLATRLAPGPEPEDPSVTTTATAAHRIAIAQLVTTALLADVAQLVELVPGLAAAVDEHVVLWSPTLHAASRSELVAALAALDDAVVDVRVDDQRVTLCGERAFVEWHVTGRFENVAILNDDVLVEPSHRAVESVGVMVLAFRGERVSRIDCYFDPLALLEQTLTPTAVNEARES